MNRDASRNWNVIKKLIDLRALAATSLENGETSHSEIDYELNHFVPKMSEVYPPFGVSKIQGKLC